MGAAVAHPEIDLTMDDIPDLHGILASMRAEGPVAEVRSNGEPAWIILTYEALRDALRDEDTFPSEASYSRTTDPATGRTLNSMQGAEHTRNRGVVSPRFRRQRMQQFGRDLVEPVCRELVDGLAGRPEVDLREELTHRLPMEVITRLLGLPAEDTEALERWSNALFTYPFDPAGALAAKAEFTEFLERVMAQRRASPSDDLVSMLVHADADGRALSDEEILSFLRLLFPAGTHNTTNGIGNLFFALLEEPERLARVRADPDLRQWAIEEALRWEPPVGNIPRRVNATGARFRGVDLPPDAAVLYSFAAAGRDPAMFAEPNHFDLDRRPQEMLSFGLGEHFCLGAWLARLEMRVALDVVLARASRLELADVDAARPRGGLLRGPATLPVSVEW